MSTNEQLEIQAYVDGQLSPVDARRVERRLAEDPSASALATDLREVAAVLRRGEPGREVPETRDFYFAQIRRRIEAEEAGAARQVAAPVVGFNWIRSMLLPALGVACVTALAVLTLRGTARGPYIPGEIEIASEEMSAITFRSDMNRMTVVYLYEKDPADIPGIAPVDHAD